MGAFDLEIFFFELESLLKPFQWLTISEVWKSDCCRSMRLWGGLVLGLLFCHFLPNSLHSKRSRYSWFNTAVVIHSSFSRLSLYYYNFLLAQFLLLMQILNPTILVPQNPLSSLSASAYLITSFEAEEILKLRSVYKVQKERGGPRQILCGRGQPGTLINYAMADSRVSTLCWIHDPDGNLFKTRGIRAKMPWSQKFSRQWLRWSDIRSRSPCAPGIRISRTPSFLACPVLS